MPTDSYIDIRSFQELNDALVRYTTRRQEEKDALINMQAVARTESARAVAQAQRNERAKLADETKKGIRHLKNLISAKHAAGNREKEQAFNEQMRLIRASEACRESDRQEAESLEARRIAQLELEQRMASRD